MGVPSQSSQAQLLLSESNEPSPLYQVLFRALSLNTQSELYLLLSNEVWNHSQQAYRETTIISLLSYLWFIIK